MLKLLTTQRINAIMRAIVEVSTIPANFVWLNRTRQIDAIDEEMLAYLSQDITIAPIIADGQRAVTDNNISLETEKNKLANIKQGADFQQPVLTRIRTIERYNITDETGVVNDILNSTVAGLLTSIRQQMELMRVSMALDSYVYDRLGVKFTASWGTPAAFKVTVPTLWTTGNVSTATPIKNITDQVDVRTRYGEVSNRVTMSTATFDYMSATDEFLDKAKPFFGPGLTADNYVLENRSLRLTLAGRILNLTIELDDRTYEERQNDGSKVVKKYLPDGKVIIGNSADDNSEMAADFANTVPTEAIVDAVGNTNLGLSPTQVGPIAYIESTLNAPSVKAWAVARTFPRKKRKTMESVLTVL